MKKLTSIVEVEGEGLVKLLGQVVTLFCVNYFYTGILAGINDDCVLLEDPKIIYETGEWSKKDWTDAQKLPGDIYVMKAAIEAFGICK